MNKFIIALLLGSILFSCRKDVPPVGTDEIIIIGNRGVYITNEGNFMFGNATVSYYDITNNSSVEDLYEPANSIPLGDVCQSMCFFNNKAYIVVNNSGQVSVVNPETFEETTVITGFTSPRYFLPVSNNKAYVTDLYSNAVSVVDLSTNSVTGNIPCYGWTEKLVLSYGKAFVTNPQKDYLYVINTANDEISDSILIVRGAGSIAEDKNGKLWVLCSGNSSASVYAALIRINPINNAVEQTFTFGSLSDSPGKLCFNGSNDTLYFLNNGVYQMEISSFTLPTQALIAEGSMNFYGLGIDPDNGTVYVSDAIDYVQRGVILRYHPNGSFINSFLAGIIPGEFYFR